MPKPRPITCSPERLKARSRLARASQQAASNPEAVEDARRTYNYASVADYIRTIVDAAPPLTAAQRDKLALLLRGGADDAA